MGNKRIFTSFAIEDKQSRDFLIGQSRNKNSPFEFVDMSVKNPWDNSWKTQCRTRIKGCHGLIVLISKNTMKAEGARWEIQCAQEEGIPVLGVHIYSTNKGAVPPELQGCRVIEWNWDGIAAFINSLP